MCHYLSVSVKTCKPHVNTCISAWVSAVKHTC